MRKVRAKSIDNIFLSTPSARRATRGGRRSLEPVADFYPRPPRGGRRSTSKNDRVNHLISIHALREEGDGRGGPCSGTCRHFYPRPPRGGRPSLLLTSFLVRLISIHALREEGDTRALLPS